MKIIKKMSILTLSLVLLFLFSSCNPPLDNGLESTTTSDTQNSLTVVVPEEYKVCTSDELEASDIRDPHSKYKKTNVPNKIITLFGRELELEYNETVSSIYRPNDVDWYVQRYPERGLLMIAFDEKTGELKQYGDSLAGENRSFKSEVEPGSSKEEFVEYAKSILSEYVSLDGYEMSVSTEIVETALEGEETYQTGFVNLFERDSSVNAEYTFTFYKTISGLRRKDNISIILNNTGEIRSLLILNYDEAYAPFENVNIDVEKLNQAVGISSGSYVLIAEGNVLWAQVGVVDSKPGGASAGLVYFVKVAEIVEE